MIEIKKIFKYLENLNNLKFIILLTIISFVSKIIFSSFSLLIFSIFKKQDLALLQISDQGDYTGIAAIIIGGIIGPILETILNQWIPITILSKFIKNNYLVIILTSIIFALSHYPNIAFYLPSFILGVIFSWAWIIKHKKSTKESFLVVTAIHSLHNLFSLLFTNIPLLFS